MPFPINVYRGVKIELSESIPTHSPPPQNGSLSAESDVLFFLKVMKKDIKKSRALPEREIVLSCYVLFCTVLLCSVV